MDDPRRPRPAIRDQPWLMRTYAGHSSAALSNRLFRDNLARGQTGLSVAFDLPTQTGFDSDHKLATGEVGRVGVPVCHLGDLELLFDSIPLERMNSSLTINATAPWLLALYVALADRRGIDRARLSGTVQNDMVKEFLARGTYIFPPRPSLRIAGDVVAFAARALPKWNPINVCSYHLQEAGATPVQEVAFALATACALLDDLRASGRVADDELATVVGRVSFFVNAGPRLVAELCKLRAFARLWDEIARSRYGVADPRLRRFRYGVQVNSLGLTEQQPENNVYRILLSMLAVVLSRDTRARAVQLPAWNEALGLPRPWDQQWSLRAQQILAFETDLLDFDDLLAGSVVIEAETAATVAAVKVELERIEREGGVLAALETGALKRALIESNAARLAAIESGERVVVGVNRFTDSAPNPLVGGALAIQNIDQTEVAAQIERLKQWRAARDAHAAETALAGLRADASEGRNLMAASIDCAKAGVTTGEWADCLRALFGDYRAPTGLSGGVTAIAGGNAATGAGTLAEARHAVARAAERLGRPPKLLIGKPGLDGHSNGAEQIALRARDCGFEVIYQGIRHTPAQIVATAVQEDVHAVGLSILSGGHLAMAGSVLAGLRAAGADDIAVVVGGIIPDQDAAALKQAGIARVYTPRDYDLNAIIRDLVGVIEARCSGQAA